MKPYVSGLAYSLLIAPLVLLIGCTAPPKTQELEKAPVYTSFRDIPGITEEEIAAVEDLLAEYESFTYGTVLRTESFYTSNNVIGGYSALFCQWLSDLFDVEFKPVISDWDTLWTDFNAMTIDFTGELHATPQNQRLFYMTDNIIQQPLKQIRLKEPVYRQPGEAPRYGFLEYSNIEQAIKSFLPERYTQVPVNQYTQAYALLKSGEIDTYFTYGSSEAGFKVYEQEVVFEDFYPYTMLPSVSFATKNPKLVPFIAVVQKYLSQHGATYLSELYNQGEKAYRRQQFFNLLTQEERTYLRTYQQTGALIPVVMEEDNYPTTFYNSQERQWQGIAVDILAEISDLSGITFRTANRITDNFPDLLDMVKRGEVAMIGELVRTFRREGSFIWSARPYASDYYALLSRSDYNDVSINNIPYARVGLIANATVYADIFREWFPYHPNTVEYPSLYQGFEALEQGEIDLLMASRNLLLTITHYHERPGFKANYIFAQSYDSLFAFNKNETILCSVVNKAQSFINTQQIVERWIRRVFDYQGTLARSQRPYLVGLSVLLFVVLGLLTIMLVRNKQMKKYLEETVSKRTEELEIQTKLAEAASEAKSQFLASMSHEIRTPMNAIIGMSDLMRTDNLDQVQLGYFNDIKKMAKALLQIINDILDFSKIEAGKMELFPVHYSVSSLFDNICSMSTFTAMAKELEFRHSFDPRLPSVLYGDEVRVRQVVTNIVNNAVKYTREGYVYLKADRVSRNGAEWVAFMVQDSGLGIKKEDLPKLFGKFQQFDSRKNRGIVGTGLGLSITKNLVEMMGGEIEVESEYEKGSIFRVYLPLVEGDEGLIEHTHATGRVLAQEGVRILVVDDNSINLTVALGFLATHNIAADTALSGPAAIQMVQQKQYDLVFMDHMMPEMDGIEATTRIRALDGVWYKNMPIIALSANAVSGARESFLAGGMNDFISKPIDTEQLNLTLLKWLPPEKIAGTVPVPEAGQGDGEKPQEVDPEAGPLKELTDIAGLDLRTGLSHVGNDQGTYITILRQFCKEFPDYVAEIQRFRAEENWKEYSIRLHGIKGVLANMGMEKLSQWAYQLEQASKGEDYAVCREETEGICEALYQFWDALRRTAVLDAGEALQREPVEGAVLWETLDALADACRTGESEKADRLAGELDRIGSAGVEEAALKEISELVASLDYDVVVEKIATLREA